MNHTLPENGEFWILRGFLILEYNRALGKNGRFSPLMRLMALAATSRSTTGGLGGHRSNIGRFQMAMVALLRCADMVFVRELVVREYELGGSCARPKSTQILRKIRLPHHLNPFS